MASIIKNDEQLKALKEIEDGLEAIKQINAIVSSDAKGAFFGAGEKGKATRIEVDPKEAKPFIAFCVKTKTRMTKEILAKAEKYRISLDASEKALLSTDAAEK